MERAAVEIDDGGRIRAGGNEQPVDEPADPAGNRKADQERGARQLSAQYLAGEGARCFEPDAVLRQALSGKLCRACDDVVIIERVRRDNAHMRCAARELRRADRDTAHLANRAGLPDDAMAQSSGNVIGHRLGRTLRHRRADQTGLLGDRRAQEEFVVGNRDRKGALDALGH